jgi:hypothetical protein
MTALLQNFKVDWRDFIAAGEATRELARRISGDRALLRNWVHGLVRDAVG